MSNEVNGLVHAYNHHNGQLCSVVELQCKTDFAARTQEFKDFAHNLALHVAQSDAANNIWLLQENMVTDPDKTVLDKLTELMDKLKEPVSIVRFQKFELGKF